MWLLFKHSTKSYFTLIGDKAPPAARDSSEVARSLKQSCYPHTGNGGLTIGVWAGAYPCR